MAGVASKVTDYFFKSLTAQKRKTGSVHGGEGLGGGGGGGIGGEGGCDVLQGVVGRHPPPTYSSRGAAATPGRAPEAGPGTDQDDDDKRRRALMKHMSPLAYAVVAYSSKVVSTSVEKLRAEFDQVFSELKERADNYDRSFVEYCFFKTIASWSPYEYSNLLDPNFRRYTFDCMVAWETPSVTARAQLDETAASVSETDIAKAQDSYESHAKEQHDEDASLFYTDLMPILVDVQDTIGMEAFVRMSPCMTLVSDSVSARPQFETLTAATSGRMPFALYDKYLQALDRSIKDFKAKNESPFLQGLSLSSDERVIEIDGVSQTVIQHVGSKSTSGRLTLTDYALYFEPSSVMSYKEAIKFKLTADVGHEVAPDLSGPWGTRIFDKAIAYKTSSFSEPIVFEFPEMIGSARRDYWLALIQEVIDCHRCIRKYGLDNEGMACCRSEALARAMLGVIRLQAVREASARVLPSKPGALLIFNLAEGFLPWGDLILEALVDTLKTSAATLMATDPHRLLDDVGDGSIAVPNSAVQTLRHLALWPLGTDHPKAPLIVYRIRPGVPTHLEKVVMESSNSSKQTQKAKALEEEVKLEGIGINIAVMNELLRPAIALLVWLRHLCSWARPLETIHVFIFLTYVIYRNWLGYIPPILLVAAGMYVIWLRVTNRVSKYREIVVQTPPGVSLEQVVSAQRAISQIQGLLQALNVLLLKIWALALSRKPEATNLVPLVFFTGALVLAVLPMRLMVFAMLVLVFTSRFRSSSNVEGKLHRRCRDLWHSIPPLPVRVVESEEEKKLQEALRS